jgi:RNA polymerase sigma factor (sigma-70 family)
MFLAKDKKLLEAFRKGDRDAMDVVYRHYRRGVTAFLRNGFSFRSGTGYFFYRGISDPKDLESAVQEVFKRSFEDRARHAYNGVTSFSNWILAIARNMVINQFRNREVAFSSYISPSDIRSHGAILDDEVTEEFSGLIYGRPARPQDVQLEKAELKDLIDAFTAELSEDDRRLLVLRFAEGMGQEETARVLGSTRMRIRTAEARLRNRLRAYLRDSGYIDHMPLGRAPTATPTPVPMAAEATGSGAHVLDDNTLAEATEGDN